MHDYNMKLPSFAFYEGCKQATMTFHFSFWTGIGILGIKIRRGGGGVPIFDTEDG